MKRILFLSFLALSITFTFCGKDDDPGTTTPDITVTTADFSASIDENPTAGAVIGTVTGSTNSGSVTFSLTTDSPSGALAVNSSSGQLTVADATIFDFETNPTITGTVQVANGAVSKTSAITITVNDVNETTPPTIWGGANMTFTKAANADPLDTANQDMFTANVILGRLNDGGQLINFATETDDDKVNSPAGTQWATGTTADVSALTFGTFRELGKPKDVLVGNDFVLKLVDDNILVDVKFISWGEMKNGAFSYERSTAN